MFSGRQYNDITSNFAEERISVCIAASSTNGARQSASETMQAAKKVVLVDEFDREYKRLQKPADAVAKTRCVRMSSQSSTVVLTVVRVMIAKYRK